MRNTPIPKKVTSLIGLLAPFAAVSNTMPLPIDLRSTSAAPGRNGEVEQISDVPGPVSSPELTMRMNRSLAARVTPH